MFTLEPVGKKTSNSDEKAVNKDRKNDAGITKGEWKPLSNLLQQAGKMMTHSIQLQNNCPRVAYNNSNMENNSQTLATAEEIPGQKLKV